MKNLFIFLLVCASLLAGFTACGKSQPVQTEPENVQNEATEEKVFNIEDCLKTFTISAENNSDREIEITYNGDFYFINKEENIYFYSGTDFQKKLDKYSENNVQLPEHYCILKDIGRTGIQINLYDDMSAEEIYKYKDADRNSHSIIEFSDIESSVVNGRNYHYFEGRFKENPENLTYRYCVMEMDGCSLLFMITTQYDGSIAQLCDTLVWDYKL